VTIHAWAWLADPTTISIAVAIAFQLLAVIILVEPLGLDDLANAPVLLRFNPPSCHSGAKSEAVISQAKTHSAT
jgi:hypothetical protein